MQATELSVACCWIKKLGAKAESNCKIYKLSLTQTLEKSSLFLHPYMYEPKKSWLWILQELKKLLVELVVEVNIAMLEEIQLSFVLNGALVMVETCALCGWWFSDTF